MSAAIDAVDLGTQRGGVLSLGADLRSTQELLPKRLYRVTGRSIVRRTPEQLDIAIFKPVRPPAAPYGDRVRSNVGLRGAALAAGAATIDGG